ncbi:MAG: hypothetical protein ACYS74_11060 [Planctomycetota bacterium]
MGIAHDAPRRVLRWRRPGPLDEVHPAAIVAVGLTAALPVFISLQQFFNNLVIIRTSIVPIITVPQARNKFSVSIRMVGRRPIKEILSACCDTKVSHSVAKLDPNGPIDACEDTTTKTPNHGEI